MKIKNQCTSSETWTTQFCIERYTTRHDLGLQDEQGQDRSTGDWVSSTFPEAERMALWKDIAPGSDYAAFISGEFALDIAKEENGQNTAFDDLTFKKTQKGTHHRFEKGADGTMSDLEADL